MFFDYGKAIDLNEYFGNKLNKFKYSAEPAHVQHLNGEDLKLVTNLAHHVVREQQKRIIIMIFNLIALAYNEKVFTSISADPPTFEELKNRMMEIVRIFECLGAIVSVDLSNLTEEIKSTISIHSKIICLSRTNDLELIKSVTIEGAKITSENSKSGHTLSPQVMNIATPVFSLQLYCNPTLFWLAEPAFFVLCLKNNDPQSKLELAVAVKKLRQIFIYEFVMYSDFESEDFERTLSALLQLKVIFENDDNYYILNKTSEYNNFLLSAIAPFMSSFLYTVTILLDNFTSSFTEKDVFKAIQSSLELQLLSENFSIHPYSLCLETINTALLSLCNQGCLTKEKR